MSEVPCAGILIAVANCLGLVVLVSVSECDDVSCFQDSVISSKLFSNKELLI